MNLRHLLVLFTLGVSAVTAAHAQSPFPAVDTSAAANPTVKIPQSPFTYKVLFREGESMVVNKDNQTAVARGAHDFTSYIPISGSSTHGYLLVNHELRDSSTAFGDGGGMTVFEAKMENNQWNVVGQYRNVDFSTVRGTWVNCGGATTPFGMALTAEEYSPVDNADLYAGGRQMRDTSDVTITVDGQTRTIKAYQNYGWMVQVDPATARATGKLWKMGRYSHEGGHCMADGKTVYLTDDNSPAVFFKFVATNANDYSDGQLYAYKQSADGMSGSWITLPMSFDSLLVIRDVAIRMGATLFIRHEWITEANGKIYLTETGLDAFNWRKQIDMGGVPARHMRERLALTDSTFVDYYGRVAEFDPNTNAFRPYLEGGAGQKDRTIHLSNPDGIAVGQIKGKTYFAINEDLNGRTMGRVGLDARRAGREIPEIYLLEASIPNPSTDDLIRFLVGPNGCETTGGVFTPDSKTYFVNIQHPSSSNPEPFNKAATIAITGFDRLSNIKDPEPEGKTSGGGFEVYPNPVSRILRFNRTTDVAMYTQNGERILVERNADRIDISSLVPGVYFLQTIDGEVQKVVVE